MKVHADDSATTLFTMHEADSAAIVVCYSVNSLRGPMALRVGQRHRVHRPAWYGLGHELPDPPEHNASLRKVASMA